MKTGIQKQNHERLPKEHSLTYHEGLPMAWINGGAGFYLGSYTSTGDKLTFFNQIIQCNSLSSI